MHRFTAVIVLTALGTGLSALAAADHSSAAHEYSGEFSEVDATSEACEQLLTPRTYGSRHQRTGPTRRTSVFHMKTGRDSSFFGGKTFVGRYGPDGDVQYEREVPHPEGGEVSVFIEGLIDPGVVVLDFWVELTPRGSDEPACEATARYAAFAER